MYTSLAATGVILIGITGGFYGYQRFEDAATATALSAPRPPVPIEAATAVVSPVPQILSGIGTLQAVHQVTISPEVGGRVVKIFFESGAQVKAGDPLIQLFDAPLRGDLATFQAQERLGRLSLGRNRDLFTHGFQSQQVVDQNQGTLDEAQGGITKTQAEIEQMLIRAPFAGVLGVRQVELGAFLNPGAPMVTLTDLSQLWVNFTLPEQAASQIHIGDPVHIRADAYPGRIFDAHITAIEPQISPQTRALFVQVTVANQDHALLPGMSAQVEAVVADETAATVIPETAVDYSLYGEIAYVINTTPGRDGNTLLKVKLTPVKTGQRFDGKVVVLSGLSPGDRVVATGQLRLNDGASVTIVPGNVLSTPPSLTRY